MKKITDERFEYSDARFMRADFRHACRLRIFQGGGRYLVLMTDLGKDSPGASVTNSVESIATAAVERFGLPPSACTFVEHYEMDAERARAGLKESFDLVNFDWVGRVASMPQWKPADRAQIFAIMDEEPPSNSRAIERSYH